jgi:hypothetical protein
LSLRVTLRTLCVATILCSMSPAAAWDGADAQTGASVEIGKGNLVRSGQDIEIYDSGAGEYRDVEVQSIQRYGGSVEVEVYDSESGEYRTLEMED